jgi:hypothetical protein
MQLAIIQPTPTRAPALDSPEWRSDFARGIRAALGAAGARPAYLVRALRAMRADLGATDLFEVSAPHASSNGKLAKNSAATLAFSGAPAASSGLNTCPASTAGCRSACVLSDACGYAAIEARAGANTIMRARARRTLALRAHPVAAGAALAIACARVARVARASDVRAVARLNVGTDLPFESMPAVADALGAFGIEAYAYTKRPAAIRAAVRNGYPVIGRTRLVYSWSESASESLACEFLGIGGNVAIVFAGLGVGRYKRAMPRAFKLGGREWQCIDGDATDDRTTDAPARIVALAGKGPLASVNPEKLARANRFGFAIDPTDPRIVW